ncbi:MAG: type II toxin-antitoxin system prevent-host-death family antitoxin [Rhizobiales bacterium]|nr:type II toxin-antitoxin system prevent-host-death family antitoxin [Hyphomicrobiales bacterium]
MTTTTITSREFNRDAGGAKRAADKGPVIITDRGRPAHVLLSYEEYRRLTGGPKSLLEALSQKDGDDIEFDPPKMRGPIAQPVDFD